MSLFFKDTEITGVHFGEQEITEIFFGSTEVFTVWGEYDGALPAQYSANGSTLADYRIYGAAGGVGDDSGTAYGYEVDMSVSDGTTSTITPIYIGDTPLGEDEYVDYGSGKIYRRYPNIFDIASIISVKRSNVVTTNGFRNIDNVITFTLTVGEHGTYSYNDELTFEPNVEYQLDFDVYLTGTSTSNYIAIALTNIAVTDLISNQYFNYEVSKDSWVHVNVSLTPTESAGMLRIQARNTGNYIQLKNVVLRKSGVQPIDPPVPLPALPTVDGTTITDYAGQSAAVPSRFTAKYRKEGY